MLFTFEFSSKMGVFAPLNNKTGAKIEVKEVIYD